MAAQKVHFIRYQKEIFERTSYFDPMDLRYVTYATIFMVGSPNKVTAKMTPYFF